MLRTHSNLKYIQLFIGYVNQVKKIKAVAMKIASILETRRQIIKSASLIHLTEKDSDMGMQIIHTGQHYDYEMSKEFFEELNLLDPIVDLNIRSGTHAWQTEKMMIRLEKVLVKEKPDLVIVPGDTYKRISNSFSVKKR